MVLVINLQFLSNNFFLCPFCWSVSYNIAKHSCWFFSNTSIDQKMSPKQGYKLFAVSVYNLIIGKSRISLTVVSGFLALWELPTTGNYSICNLGMPPPGSFPTLNLRTLHITNSVLSQSSSTLWEHVKNRNPPAHYTPVKLETPGYGCLNFCLKKSSKWFWCTLKFENSCVLLTNTLH